jgi:hypothetical protein
LTAGYLVASLNRSGTELRAFRQAIAHEGTRKPHMLEWAALHRTGFSEAHIMLKVTTGNLILKLVAGGGVGVG